MSASNGFEAYHRSEKVSRMLEQADREAMAGKVEPFLCAREIAATWRLATKPHFLELARKANVKPPSDDTIEAFLKRLEERAS